MQCSCSTELRALWPPALCITHSRSRTYMHTRSHARAYLSTCTPALGYPCKSAHSQAKRIYALACAQQLAACKAIRNLAVSADNRHQISSSGFYKRTHTLLPSPSLALSCYMRCWSFAVHRCVLRRVCIHVSARKYAHCGMHERITDSVCASCDLVRMRVHKRMQSALLLALNLGCREALCDVEADVEITIALLFPIPPPPPFWYFTSLCLCVYVSMVYVSMVGRCSLGIQKNTRRYEDSHQQP